MKTLLASLLLFSVTVKAQVVRQNGGSSSSSLSPAATVNAGQLTNGPISSSVLPSTVAFTSVDNNWSFPQTFQAASSVTVRAAFEATASTIRGVEVITGSSTVQGILRAEAQTFLNGTTTAESSVTVRSPAIVYGDFIVGTSTGGAGTGWPGRVSIVSQDTTVKPAISIRASNNSNYGFDIDHEQNATGTLDYYGVIAGARSLIMQLSRATNNVLFSGSTMTVANTGIITAPSQPGSRATTGGNLNTTNSAYVKLFFGNEGCNGCYDRGSLHDATSSSGTFITRGAGIYFLQCCVVFAGNGATTLQTVLVADDLANTNVWANWSGTDAGTSAPQRCATGFASLPDAQNVQCNVRVDTAGVSITNSVSTQMTVQRVW